MADSISTWCRLSDCAAPLTARVDGGRVVALAGDDEHALGRSHPCGLCAASVGAASDRRRVLRPRKRVGDRWEEVSWEAALAEIGGRLKEIRRQGGPSAMGVYAGAPAALHTATLVRTLAWPLATGSPGLYTPLTHRGAPWLRAAELVIGHAVPLQGDVGRAHYVVLLGANQEAQGWGPLQAGDDLGAELAHSRKTKGTKLITVDPRRTPIASRADLHFGIRPGTELWFVLGMIDAILQNGWRDVQYTDDWCAGRDALAEALAPWTLDRCGGICGVSPKDIAGVALKFARASMGVAHPSAQALGSAHGTLTAWAILVLHALTANLLRPGGLYESRGLLDLHGLARALRSDAAPRTRSRGYPLLWLQSPGSVLADDVLVPGDGALRALLTVHGDPARDEAGGPRVREALEALDLLVAIDVADTATTRLAHWVLPATHAWEQADLHLADTPLLPRRHTARTPALVSPPGEARPADAILADLFRGVGPALRGSPLGGALRLRGGRLIGADLDAWAARQLSGRGFPGASALDGRGWDGGDVDRAGWTIGTPSGKIELLPGPIAEALARLDEPHAGPGLDRWLLTGAARDRALRAFDRPPGDDPGVTLHPSAGFAAGERVRVRTRAGAVEAVVHLDEGLRPDCVDLPAGHGADVGAIIPGDQLDPLTGTPAWNGLACAVERA